MEHDNFNFHVVPDCVRFYHKNLRELIEAVDEENKEGLERWSTRLSKISGRPIKIEWGDKSLGLDNILKYIDAGNREGLSLEEKNSIKTGYLTYHGHNLNDKSRACAFSVLLRYISILIEKSIKLYDYP